MMRTLYDKYDKTKIKDLPPARFKGRIVVVISESEAARAVDYLLSQDILGMDTETRPSFRKGTIHKVALLQVSTREICFLFRLSLTGITSSIKRLLEDTTVTKAGLSWHDDLLSLHKRAPFEAGSYVDIQDCAAEIGIADRSLQKLYANIFGRRISKTQQLSNWDADILTEAQKMYAATDAWACIMLYDELTRLKRTGDYRIEMKNEEFSE